MNHKQAINSSVNYGIFCGDNTWWCGIFVIVRGTSSPHSKELPPADSQVILTSHFLQKNTLNKQGVDYILYTVLYMLLLLYLTVKLVIIASVPEVNFINHDFRIQYFKPTLCRLHIPI